MFHQVLCLFSLLLLLPTLTNSQSCGAPCNPKTGACSDGLTCVNGICTDAPGVKIRICSGAVEANNGGGGSGGSGDRRYDTCQPSGTLTCPGKTPQPTFSCSPPVMSSTHAILTINDFRKGGDSGGSSKCDESFHDNSEPVVALSTGWFADSTRCGQMIRIVAENGQSTTAKVVDECDSQHGCDDEHDGQGPCRNNVVDASSAVWEALGYDTRDPSQLEANVTWSMA